MCLLSSQSYVCCWYLILYINMCNVIAFVAMARVWLRNVQRISANIWFQNFIPNTSKAHCSQIVAICESIFHYTWSHPSNCDKIHLDCSITNQYVSQTIWANNVNIAIIVTLQCSTQSVSLSWIYSQYWISWNRDCSKMREGNRRHRNFAYEIEALLSD